MESVSTRLEDETARLIRETADERDVSVAEVLRERIEQGMVYEDLERELEQTEARVEDLRRQLQQTNSRERDVDEIVTYVEEERRLQQRREERRDAPVWTRAKWWLFGSLHRRRGRMSVAAGRPLGVVRRLSQRATRNVVFGGGGLQADGSSSSSVATRGAAPAGVARRARHRGPSRGCG